MMLRSFEPRNTLKNTKSILDHFRVFRGWSLSPVLGDEAESRIQVGRLSGKNFASVWSFGRGVTSETAIMAMVEPATIETTG